MLRKNNISQKGTRQILFLIFLKKYWVILCFKDCCNNVVRRKICVKHIKNTGVLCVIAIGAANVDTSGIHR